MSFDEHPTPEGEPEHTPESSEHHKPKPYPDGVTLEDIAKMSLKELARIAGSLEHEWCGHWDNYGGGWCRGE